LLGANSNLPVVEDAAQAFGATSGGRPAGSFGDIAAFSLNPMKPLAALGEAGAVVTDRVDLAERIASLRYLGTVDRETCIDPSLNYKIDTLQAIILRHRMKRVSQVVACRNRIADVYSQALRDVVLVPESPKTGTSTYFDYTILCDRRDALERFLVEQGIEVKVKHRLLLTQQPSYGHINNGPTPNAERLVKGSLSLPIHEALTEPEIERVVNAIHRFYGG
jgi:dTDP-4-amino-4,6-dideoxygalactose transaminase